MVASTTDDQHFASKRKLACRGGRGKEGWGGIGYRLVYREEAGAVLDDRRPALCLEEEVSLRVRGRGKGDWGEARHGAREGGLGGGLDNWRLKLRLEEDIGL
jgi:hypothetical protein